MSMILVHVKGTDREKKPTILWTVCLILSEIRTHERASVSVYVCEWWGLYICATYSQFDYFNNQIILIKALHENLMKPALKLLQRALLWWTQQLICWAENKDSGETLLEDNSLSPFFIGGSWILPIAFNALSWLISAFRWPLWDLVYLQSQCLGSKAWIGVANLKDTAERAGQPIHTLYPNYRLLYQTFHGWGMCKLLFLACRPLLVTLHTHTLKKMT